MMDIILLISRIVQHERYKNCLSYCILGILKNDCYSKIHICLLNLLTLQLFPTYRITKKSESRQLVSCLGRRKLFAHYWINNKIIEIQFYQGNVEKDIWINCTKCLIFFFFTLSAVKITTFQSIVVLFKLLESNDSMCALLLLFPFM